MFDGSDRGGSSGTHLAWNGRAGDGCSGHKNLLKMVPGFFPTEKPTEHPAGSRLSTCRIPYVNVYLHLHSCQAEFRQSGIKESMIRKALAPQQARSRESTRKLLKAATEVLGQHGVEGTTIPRIAQHAGLTPGALYRRFPDKDALLETVIIGILERQQERLRMALTPAMARQIPLAVFAE